MIIAIYLELPTYAISLYCLFIFYCGTRVMNAILHCENIFLHTQIVFVLHVRLTKRRPAPVGRWIAMGSKRERISHWNFENHNLLVFFEFFLLLFNLVKTIRHWRTKKKIIKPIYRIETEHSLSTWRCLWYNTCINNRFLCYPTYYFTNFYELPLQTTYLQYRCGTVFNYHHCYK